MAGGVEAAEVAGHKPAVDDGFGGKFGLVEVAGHYGLAANGDLAEAVGIGIENANLHAGERFANGVRAERLQIVDGDGGACFGEAVAVGDWDAEVVEKLQGLRLGEGAADDDSAELAAKGVVDLLEEEAAQGEAGLTFCEGFVDGDKGVEDFSLT